MVSAIFANNGFIGKELGKKRWIECNLVRGIIEKIKTSVSQ